jgi:hypothetical protein
MKKVVAERMTQLGRAGHASGYAPIPMAQRAKACAAAALA